MATIHATQMALEYVFLDGKDSTVHTLFVQTTVIQSMDIATLQEAASADMVGKDDSVMSAFPIKAVCMEPVKRNGSVTVKKAGEVCSVIMISTTARIIVHARMELPVLTLARAVIHAHVSQSLLG